MAPTPSVELRRRYRFARQIMRSDRTCDPLLLLSYVIVPTHDICAAEAYEALSDHGGTERSHGETDASLS
jgi:hypothetical protein